MRLLAMDTAWGASSAALMEDGTLTHHFMDPATQQQATGLVPAIADMLDAAEQRLEAIDVLACTVGPGSFTGLRIGMAAAQGMALATDAPLLGVSTLECVAHAVLAQHPEIDHVLVVLDARRKQYYTERFTRADAEAVPYMASGARLIAHADIEGWIAAQCDSGQAEEATMLAGNAPQVAAMQEDTALAYKPITPSALHCAEVARCYLATPQASWPVFAPCYVRAPDAVPAGPAAIDLDRSHG